MSLEDSIKATAKDAEGRLQAAAGALSGDNTMQAKGEAKQVHAQVMHAAGELKDKAASAVGDALHRITGQ